MNEQEAEYQARRAAGETFWRNRIVGYGEADPKVLRASPFNWRRHPQDQQAALGDLLGEIGVVQNIMVNRRTGDAWPPGERNVETIVDGHLRVMLALRHNQPIIPVTYVDLDPQEEALVLASFDPVAAMAQADKQALDAVLRQVETESAAIQQLVAQTAQTAQTAEKAGMYGEFDPSGVTFPEYDENVADSVEYNECPKCGHKWPK